ncbi:MAG: FAD-dependent oxidoreductase [bacterium]|nr:FAD-dependent oxidoreductase [bacterium]
MSEPAYPLLFSPLRIGGLELRNRIVLSAMTTGFGFSQGAPEAEALAYYHTRSRGTALATVGFSAVAPEGRVENAIAWLWPEGAAEALAPLAEAIAAAGAHPCIQLGHGGRQVSPDVIGEQPVAPSAVQAGAHVRVAPRPLSTVEVDDVVTGFGRAAERAAGSGFTAVEVHGGHGYLIQQFLAAESNRRTDRFGGPTVAERSRFGCEVIEAIRRAAPEVAVVLRINGSDLVPDGLQAADAVIAAQRFAEAGADAFVVSAGVYGSVPWTIPLLDDPEGAFLELAAEVRRNVDVPVIGVGRITTPESAEAALRGRRCDAVGLGRALLADEDWVAKARDGRPEGIRPCIATVEGCAGRLQYGEAISCSVNPGVGRETNQPLERAEMPGSVLVIGGGPAGMEAARRAAQLGHDVHLAERADRLGGALNLAAATPGLGHLARLAGWYEGELERLRVTVSLDTDISGPGDLARIPADYLVLATGAQTAPEVLDGYEHLPAWTLEDLLDGRASSHDTWHLIDPVTVLGGGGRALAAALWCRRGGYRVSLLSGERIGHDTSGLARRAYLSRLAATAVRGRARRITEAGVEWLNEAGARSVLPARSIVVAEPLRSSFPAALTPRGGGADGGPNAAGVHTVRIGDARSPRTIGDAIAEARQVVEALPALAG